MSRTGTTKPLQIAIVTGAATGLDRASAIALGPTAIAFVADVSAEDEVDTVVAETVRRFGALHMLVKNPGLQRGAKFKNMTLKQWRIVTMSTLAGSFFGRTAEREFLRCGMQLEVLRALETIILTNSATRRSRGPSQQTMPPRTAAWHC